MIEQYFGGLESTGKVSTDVAAFLTDAGYLHTLAHIRQVAGQARIIAARFGADMANDMKRAAAAAWCHDIAAVVPREQMVAFAEELAIPLTESDRAIPMLVHGPLAAEVARLKLGIQDEEALDAIRYHSTLRAGAGFLEKVVFVADKVALDPASPRDDFLPAINAAMKDGLDAMAFVYVDWVMQNADDLGWTIHEHLREAHEDLKGSLFASHV